MGKVEARFIIEIAGHPKGHVEEVMKKVVERIKGDKEVIAYQIFEAKEVKNLWSTFTEMDVGFEDIPEVFGFCYDQLPSSVEILKPKEISLDYGKLSDMVNDLLAKLHELDSTTKNLKATNILLQKKLKEKG